MSQQPSAEKDVLCGLPSGPEWECRALKDHADGMHVWGQTDRAALFHSGWSERTPTLHLPVTVDRETALRLLRDPDFRARYAASLRSPLPPGGGRT